MDSHLPAGLREGDIVATKYRIENRIGAGAMGTVVAAHHLLLAERVAIKFLHPRSVENVEARARFIREARAANHIKNEHVVRVIDISTLESGDLYIVMEFLEGCDLAKWLQTHGPLAVDDAVDYVLQACEGLSEAHELGIVHRDLKPENLFAVQRAGAIETIKVLDFGISKTTDGPPPTVDPGDTHGVTTGESSLMGSPPYMSPEQMQSSRDVDARTDIWALGIVLCELVTGRRPFDGRSPIEVYHQIMSRSMPDLGGDGRLPAGLEAVIRTCIARDRDRRYGSIRDFAVALQPFGSADALASVERIARARPVVARSSIRPAQAPCRTGIPVEDVDSPKTLPSFGQGPQPAAPHGSTSTGRWWRYVGAAALALAISGSAVVVAKRTRGRWGSADAQVPMASRVAAEVPTAPRDAPLATPATALEEESHRAPEATAHAPAASRRSPRAQPATTTPTTASSESRSSAELASPTGVPSSSSALQAPPAAATASTDATRSAPDPDAEDKELQIFLRPRK